METDDPNPLNLVYSPNSNGFYEVSPWLVKDAESHEIISGTLIEEYAGYEDVEVDNNLEVEGSFKYSFLLSNLQPQTPTLGFSTHPADSQDDWNEYVSTMGKANVELAFVANDPDKPTLTISSNNTTPCYVMSTLPDSRMECLVVDIDEYTPLPWTYDSSSMDIDDEPEMGNDGEPTGDTIRTLSFRMKMRVKHKKFALKQDSDYIDPSGLYVKCNPGGTVETQYVLVMHDIHQNDVGSLDYGYVSLPSNLDDAADKTYYSSIANGGSIDDVPHRTIYEYMWTHPAYFKLSNFEGKGLDCPVTLDVLPPGQMFKEDGDIYNRVYEVEMKVPASHVDMNVIDADIWLDKASMAASIFAPITDFEWKKLIYNENVEDSAIPPRMRESVLKLVDKTCKLDNAYFGQVLTQLQVFLEMIRDELSLDLNEEEIAGLCKFGYSISGVTFVNHSSEKDNWNKEDGLFGHRDGVAGTRYGNCLQNFNAHLLDEFKSDWREMNVSVTQDDIQNRDYYNILKDNYLTVGGIDTLRNETLGMLYSERNQPPETSPTIDEIFKDGEDETWSNKVRYINAIRTTLKGSLTGMFVANDICNMFVEIGSEDTKRMQWYTFSADKFTMDGLVQGKLASGGQDYDFGPTMKFTRYPICDTGWLFKMLNRDFVGTSTIDDAFAVHCRDGNRDLWYVPQLDSYFHPASSELQILDMAYEQYGDRLYVLFNGDNYLYAYDGAAQGRGFDGVVELRKETASVKLVTFNSMCITDRNLYFDRMFLDYFRTEQDEDEKYHNWNLVLYGTSVKNGTPTEYNKETWKFRPGLGRDDYLQYNTIVFGDSLFDEGQLRFHNISKNKDMYELLSVDEAGGYYYGLFKNNDSNSKFNGEDTYVVFKVGKSGGVVQRLPWQILVPHMYRTNDSLYSLYVVSNEPLGE